MEESKPKYTITGMEPTSYLPDAGPPVPATRVRFRTHLGHTGTVVVPMSDAHADDIHRTVNAVADQLIDAASRPVPPVIMPPGRM